MFTLYMSVLDTAFTQSIFRTIYYKFEVYYLLEEVGSTSIGIVHFAIQRYMSMPCSVAHLLRKEFIISPTVI